METVPALKTFPGGVSDHFVLNAPRADPTLTEYCGLRGCAATRTGQASSSFSIAIRRLRTNVRTEFIARGADVAVMVIEAETITKTELKRAAACLERIKVPAVAAVLNRVALEAGDGFARGARTEFQGGSAASGAGLLGWFLK